MRLTRYLFVFLIFFSLVSAVSARPKIGLVLGGGGASGVAHVGVLKVLEANNIPIDMIAGTSMGAIVGGLYASGMSAAELEKTVNSLDWISLFTDDQSRREKGFHQKRVESGFFSNFELGIKQGSLKTPSGLVTGQKLMFELRDLFAPVGHISNFDQLPIPFRAVATNIETGKPVILKSGNLAQSVRASMAIPGMFSPVEIDNQLLVDGFVSNNVPVSVGREMGADILIVVNIPTFLEKQAELDSAVTISLQAMQLMMLKTTEPELAKMLPSDILIEPGIKDIGNLDFERVSETIPLGSQAALTQLKRLKALAVPSLKLAHQNATKQAKGANAGLRIARIEIKNSSVLKDSILVRQLGLKAGDAFNSSKLQQGLENIHGLGYFELVDHRVSKDASGELELFINARKKTNGDQRLRFGLSIADDLDGDTSYQFGVKHTLQGINDRGGEWSNGLIIGDTIRFDSALYQPIPEEDAFIDAQFWHEQRDFFFYEGEERLSEVRGRGVGLQLDVGREFDNWGESRAGLFYRYVEPDLKTGENSGAFDRRILAAGLQFQYNVDTMDDGLLPMTGEKFSVEYTHGFKELGSDQAFDRVWVRGQKAWNKDKHRILASAEIGSTFANDVLLSEQLSLGGLGRMSGLAEDQLVGNHLLAGSLVYMYELSEAASFAQFYAGGSLEVGNVWERHEDVHAEDLLVGASLFVGADTPLGPAFMGVAQTEGYSMQPFLYLGQSF